METKQERGVGSFFFAAIPAVLVVAALLAIACYTNVITFHWQEQAHDQQQTVEKRMDNRVGVEKVQTSPIQIAFSSHYCVHIDRAYLDGGQVIAYLSNRCGGYQGYYEIHWKELAPDGTIVKGGYDNTATMPALESGDKYEYRQSLGDLNYETGETHIDHRVAKVEVYTTGNER